MALCEQDSDIHPEVAYQVGATPNGVERARNHCKFVESLPNDQKPITEVRLSGVPFCPVLPYFSA